MHGVPVTQVLVHDGDQQVICMWRDPAPYSLETGVWYEFTGVLNKAGDKQILMAPEVAEMEDQSGVIMAPAAVDTANAEHSSRPDQHEHLDRSEQSEQSEQSIEEMALAAMGHRGDAHAAQLATEALEHSDDAYNDEAVVSPGSGKKAKKIALPFNVGRRAAVIAASLVVVSTLAVGLMVHASGQSSAQRDALLSKASSDSSASAGGLSGNSFDSSINTNSSNSSGASGVAPTAPAVVTKTLDTPNDCDLKDIPFSSSSKNDPSIPAGQTQVSPAGVNGQDKYCYIHGREQPPVVTRAKNPVNQVTLVGTGAAQTTSPSTDPTTPTGTPTDNSGGLVHPSPTPPQPSPATP